MRRVRLRYEKSSILKKVPLRHTDSWDCVKSKIATSFGIQIPLPDDTRIVVSDAELETCDEMPTIGSYIDQLHNGIGCTGFGLYIPEREEDSSRYHGCSSKNKVTHDYKLPLNMFLLIPARDRTIWKSCAHVRDSDKLSGRAHSSDSQV